MRQDFEAGQLRKFVDEWCKLTSDPFILDIVKHCHLGIEEQNITHLFSEEVEYRFNDDEKVIMNKEIDNLLRLKVIKETHKQECQIISPVFLRKKKDGGYRMVINLKKLNRESKLIDVILLTIQLVLAKKAAKYLWVQVWPQATTF